jgi:hypothetical protein
MKALTYITLFSKGPELLANGDFAGDSTTGWVGFGAGGWSVTGGAASHTAGTYGTISRGYNTLGLVVDRTYEIRFDMTRSAGDINVYMRNVLVGNVGATGSQRLTVRCASTGAADLVFETSNFTGTLDNISVRRN